MLGKIRLLVAALILAHIATGCGGGDSRTSPTLYAISGTVSSSGAGLQGVVVSLDSGRAVVTDASGNYTFKNIANGSHTITPARLGYTFSPSTLTVKVMDADVEGINYVVTANSSLSCAAWHGSGTNGIQFYNYGNILVQDSSAAANAATTSTLTWQAQYQNIFNYPPSAYSGSLRARLWAVPYSVSSGVFNNAYVIGVFYPSFTGSGAASSNQLYVDSISTIQITHSSNHNPPAGEYCIAATLEEYNLNTSYCSSPDHYCANDWWQSGNAWIFY